MTLIEAAVETLADSIKAERDGAARLELCADLDGGGQTPALELIREVHAAVTIPTMVMIRPRRGNYVYTGAELDQMLREIAAVGEIGMAGVVFGPLRADDTIDRVQLARLVRAAGGMETVFHRAIDTTPDIRVAIGVLVEEGLTRVLTSGGKRNVEEGLETVAELIPRFRGQIEILPGGGIRAANVARIVRDTGASQVHVGLQVGAEPGRITDVVAQLRGR